MAQAPLGANPRPLDPQPCRVVPISGEFAYRFTEPNALALDFARWRVDDGAWQEADEVLKVDRKARAMLGLAPRGARPSMARALRSTLSTSSASCHAPSSTRHRAKSNAKALGSVKR